MALEALIPYTFGTHLRVHCIPWRRRLHHNVIKASAFPGGVDYIMMSSRHLINIKGNLGCPAPQPPESCHPATWKLHSNVAVETSSSRYHLNVESLIQHQLLMPPGLGEYCCFLPSDGVMFLPGVLCNCWLLQCPSLASILMFLHPGFHIQMVPTGDHLNRDIGMELPGCWMTTVRRLGSRTA